MDLIEKLGDQVKTVNVFCYLRDKLNASGNVPSKTKVSA